MTNAEKNAAIKSTIVEMLLSNLPDGSIQVGAFTFAIPVTVDGEARWGEIALTAKNSKATKVAAAYDPEAKRADWLAEMDERERKAQEKAEKKAAKMKADKAAREAKAAE